jgi:hypothetical protein
MYTRGRFTRVVSQRQPTGHELATKILQVLYRTSWKFFEDIGEDPAYFMPKDHSDAWNTYNFKEVGSTFYFETAGGQGVGQAGRTDHLYFTEFQDANPAEQSFDALVGSMPLGSPDTRVVVDYNATDRWMGSAAFNMWERARKGAGDPEWNGYLAFFVGTRDVPQWYPADMLDEKRMEMGDRYILSYPEKPEDMYAQRARSVHKLEEIRASHAKTGGRFLWDVFRKRAGTDEGADAMVRQCRPTHGVDCSLVDAEDSDWQAAVSFAWYDGMWWEICEPLHERVKQDVFARKFVDERLKRFGGLVVPERNQGEAFMIALKHLIRDTKLPHGGRIYKHKERDQNGQTVYKLGFPTQGRHGPKPGTKHTMIAECDALLRSGELGLVSELTRQEFAHAEWYIDDDGIEGRGLAGAPKRRGAHDDVWMATLAMVQGTKVPRVSGKSY